MLRALPVVICSTAGSTGRFAQPVEQALGTEGTVPSFSLCLLRPTVPLQSPWYVAGKPRSDPSVAFLGTQEQPCPISRTSRHPSSNDGRGHLACRRNS